MNNLFLIILNFLYLADVFIIGGVILRFFKLKFTNEVEEKIFAFALGNIFYSLLFIYLGFSHLLYSQIIFLAYVLPLIFSLPKFYGRYLSEGLRTKFGLSLDKKIPIREYLVFTFISFLLLPVVPHLFSFPTSWDVVAYHLVLPKIYLYDHLLSFYDWFSQTTFPIGIEALFGLGEVLREPRLSNFIVFDFVTMIIVYLIYGLRSLFKLRILLLAVFLFMFRKILYSDVSFNPYVDFPLAFYGLLISISLFKFFQKGKVQDLLLVVYFGLFTVLIKFSGIMIGFSFLATLGLSLIGLKMKERRKIITSLVSRKNLLFGLFIGLPILLYFSRNYFYTGNPVHPYLNNIFKGLYYNQADLGAMMADLRRQNLSFDMISRILLRLPIESAEMALILRESLFSFVLVLFTAFGLLNKEREIRYSAVFSFLFFGLVVLMVGFPSYRYALPLIPMMALLTSLGFWGFLEKRRFIQAGFIFIFLYSLIIQASSTLEYLGEFILLNSKAGVKSMLSYGQAKKGLAGQDNWQAIEYLNQHLDAEREKVLALFDNRLYYYQVPVVYDNPSISPFFANQAAKDTQEAYQRLRNEGITHLMVNTNWGEPVKVESLLLEQFLEEKTIIEASHAGTAVYRIREE